MTLNAAEHDVRSLTLTSQQAQSRQHSVHIVCVRLSTRHNSRQDFVTQFGVVTVYEVRRECLRTPLITAEHLRLPRRDLYRTVSFYPSAAAKTFLFCHSLPNIIFRRLFSLFVTPQLTSR